MTSESSSSVVEQPQTPITPDTTNAQQNISINHDTSQQAQNWMAYYQQYNMTPQQYYNYCQYWSQMNVGNIYGGTNSWVTANASQPINPPLPKEPPPPASVTAATLTPQTQKPIRFNINGLKRQLDTSNCFFQQQQIPPVQQNSLTSGAAKKKRKRNRNQQQQQQQQQNLPPLPPMPVEEEVNTPKPEPPPELPPPIPIPPTYNNLKAPSIAPVASSNGICTNNNPTDEWPESLKNYVNESYAKCRTQIDKNQVEIILKGKITQAYKTGQLNKDWSKEPLPNIHSERLMNLNKSPVPGQLSMFQKNNVNVNQKKGLSSGLGARLGNKGKATSVNIGNINNNAGFKRKSKSRSPRRKRSSSYSSSSSSSGDDEKKSTTPKNEKKTAKMKLSDRLGPANNQNSKKTNQKLSKKAKKMAKLKKAAIPFYSSFGSELEENNEILQQRAARFLKDNNNGSNSSVSNISINRTLQPVAKDKLFVVDKFTDDDDSSNVISGEFDWEQFHVVGTCRDVEKSFLRLTKAPEPCEVRPVDILEMALRNVKDRWKMKKDYYYACDQLKSIRQDLTVQGIRNEFTVEVYETHARIALEKGDHEEFNQCQTQLKMLYADVGGSNKNEFTAYRILYYIFTKNTLDMMTIMQSLSANEKKDDCIKFALKLRSAWGLGNFHKYFKLYTKAPLMSGYLIDWFIERERKQFLKCIIKSYRQTLALSFVAEEMAFKSSEDFLKFVTPFDLTFVDDSKSLIDCKASLSALSNL